MAAQARMLGVWIFISNPNRTTNDDLHLTVGYTTKLNTEALRLLADKLLTVKIDVMDEDTFSDDKLMTDQSFQIGVHDTDFHCWHQDVIVPERGKLPDRECSRGLRGTHSAAACCTERGGTFAKRNPRPSAMVG
jgi:hypothetical protein